MVYNTYIAITDPVHVCYELINIIIIIYFFVLFNPQLGVGC